MKNRLPWLVQRVKLRTPSRFPPTTSHTGVDKYFAFDYMGSAEFEFGALPLALKEMRAQENTGPERIKRDVGAKECVAWFVGPKDLLEIAESLFEDQLQPLRSKRTARLQEASRIAQAYGTDAHWKYVSDIIGWWSIDAHPWCLFKEKDHANAWLMGLADKGRKE